MATAWAAVFSSYSIFLHQVYRSTSLDLANNLKARVAARLAGP